MKEFDEAYERLRSWSQTLRNTIENNLPQIRNALTSDEPLPENCPSRASMAALILRQIKQSFDEVKGCIEDIEKQIWKEGQ